MKKGLWKAPADVHITLNPTEIQAMTYSPTSDERRSLLSEGPNQQFVSSSSSTTGSLTTLTANRHIPNEEATPLALHQVGLSLLVDSIPGASNNRTIMVMFIRLSPTPPSYIILHPSKFHTNDICYHRWKARAP